jgi:hypothetical protein
MATWGTQDELIGTVPGPPKAVAWGSDDEKATIDEIRGAGQNISYLKQARADQEASWFPNARATLIGVGGSVLPPVARALGQDEFADKANRVVSATAQAAAEQDAGGYVPPIIKRGVRGALTTIPSMVVAGRALGPYGALGVAGLQEADRSITSGRDAGLKGGDVAAYAIEQGLVEAGIGAVLQRVGLGGVEDYFKGGAGSKTIREAIGTALKRTGLQEIPEEIATELSHNVVSKLNGVDPNALSGESIRQTIADTAVQTIITGGFFGSVDAASTYNSATGNVQQSQDDAATIEPATEETPANPRAAALEALSYSPSRSNPAWAAVLPEGEQVPARASDRKALVDKLLKEQQQPVAMEWNSDLQAELDAYYDRDNRGEQLTPEEAVRFQELHEASQAYIEANYVPGSMGVPTPQAAKKVSDPRWSNEVPVNQNTPSGSVDSTAEMPSQTAPFAETQDLQPASVAAEALPQQPVQPQAPHNQTAADVAAAFDALGSGVQQGASDKQTEYAQRILAGENPADVMQGIKQGGAMWTLVMDRAAQLQAQTAQPQQPLTDQQTASTKEASQSVAETGKPFTVQAFRGSKEDAKAVGKDGSRFFSPDRAFAEAYAKRNDGTMGEVIEETISFNNPLVAKNWMVAKSELGLKRSADMPSLIAAATAAGHDGIVFLNPNGKQEYVTLSPTQTAEQVEPVPQQNDTGLTGQGQPGAVQRQSQEVAEPVPLTPAEEFGQSVQQEEFLRDVIAVMRGKDSPEMSPDQNAVLQEAGRRMEGANTPRKRRAAVQTAEKEWQAAKSNGKKAILADDPPLSPEPTTTAPGTPERIAVMRDRIAQGYAAQHPMDAGARSEMAMGIVSNQNFHNDLARSFQGLTALTRRFLKNFTKEGTLPGNVFAFLEGKNKWLGAELKQMEFNRKDLERAAKDIYGNRLNDQQQEVVDGVLKGALPITSVPLPLRKPIETMRDHVDKLSRWLIDSGAIEGPLTLTIENNMGTYLTRSYRVFDDKKWGEKVPQDVRNRAKAFIRAENPSYTEDQIEGEIRNLLFEPDAPLAYLSGGKLGSKDLSITKRRKGVPPEIRALLGEYKDPRVNYVRSVTKMANLLANHHFLTQIRNEGLGAYLFDPKNPGPNYSPEYHAELAADSSKVMAPLNGLWTTPDIKAAFEDVLNNPTHGPVARLYFKVNALTKYGKTVLSVQSNIRNFTSNAMIAVAQGHWRVGKMGDAFKGMLGGTGAQFARQWRDYYKSAVEAGIVDESVYAGELRDATRDAMDMSPEQFSDHTIDRMVRAVSGTAQAIYQAGDNVWKIYAWENEKARYKKAYPTWTDQQVADHAAEIVRNTYPTYSRISKNVKAIRRFPITGTFVSFPAEVVRTTYHTLKQTALELQNPETRQIGAQRLAGVLAASVLPAAIGLASRFLFGVGPDDEEDFREFVAPWQENSDLVWLDKPEGGEGAFIDASFSDPYNYLRTTVRAFLRGDDWEQSLTDAAWEAMSPFAEEEILFKALAEARSNKKETGGSIYNEQAPLPERFTAQLAYLWDKALEPGTITSLRRIENALSGKVSKTGRSYDPTTEIVSFGTGVRAVPIDVRQGLSFRASDYSRDTTEAERIVNSAAGNRGSVTPEEIAAAYQNTDQARRKLFGEMHRKTQAATRLGVPTTEVWKTLTSNGISQSDASLIIKGIYIPHFPSKQVIANIYDMPDGGKRIAQLRELYSQAREAMEEK